VQVCQGNDGFDSYTANSALKQMGYTLSNITRALDILQAQDPKLVMQVRKTGSSRQARKVYKLTHAGLKRVAEMLNRTKDR
jgi:DNA-binding MarR family transcriptional regulator